MLVLSLLFIALVILLVFCLTKDTGTNTKYARRNADLSESSQYQQRRNRRAVDSITVAKANS
jgi:hypothetical protein